MARPKKAEKAKDDVVHIEPAPAETPTPPPAPQKTDSKAPTGANLVRKYKALGLTLKDAYAAAIKENPDVKEASFKVGWYKKSDTSSTVKSKPGRKAAEAPKQAPIISMATDDAAFIDAIPESFREAALKGLAEQIHAIHKHKFKAENIKEALRIHLKLQKLEAELRKAQEELKAL